ncbi:MAG TPA: hypothetical protein DCM05_00540 [Elusimicrobia bacterium]|nr:hypothetical protein [Elusimicrobiota bacterium]
MCSTQAIAASPAKKSLSAYMAEAGVIQEMLKASVIEELSALHESVDPAKPSSEKPLLAELARAKRALGVFLPWRNNPKAMKSEFTKNPEAFEQKWESVGQYVDEAKMKRLRADSGIDASSGGGSWYDDYLNYLACKANPFACE